MIYFIKSRGNIKIGFATSIVDRLSMYKIERDDIELLCVIEGDKKKEKELHKMFVDFRIGKSEWFISNEGLINYIASIKGTVRELKEDVWGSIKYKTAPLVSVRMDADLYERAIAFAEQDGRTLKSLIKVALEIHMRNHKPALKPKNDNGS